MSLFTGTAGIELGIRLAIPGARTVLYVEREAYCIEVLVHRIEEGFMDEAPIWTDIASLNSKPWSGKVDIITCGLPKDKITVGKGKPGNKNRIWAWDKVSKIIDEVGPELVFLESEITEIERGLPRILGSLANSGFDAEWDLFSAAECGAPQIRKRLFILGHKRESDWRDRWSTIPDLACLLANSYSWGQGSDDDGGRGFAAGGGDEDGFSGCGEDLERYNQIPYWPPGPVEIESWDEISKRDPSVEPSICRVVDEFSDRLDLVDRTNRVQSLEKSGVPITSAIAFCLLIERAIKN